VVRNFRPIGIHWEQAAQTKLPDAGLWVVLHLLEQLLQVREAKLAGLVLLQRAQLAGSHISPTSYQLSQ
jgi:hypothetical protein